MNNLRIAVFYKKKKKVHLIKVVVSYMSLLFQRRWLPHIKLCIDNHCHKYSTDCKYNILLQFYNIFKTGKYKGLKAYIVKKQANYKTKECIHRQHFADMKFA